MARTSPRSAIPLIAIAIGLVFAVVAAVGVLKADQTGHRQEAQLSVAPPGVKLPDLPLPSLPVLPG